MSEHIQDRDQALQLLQRLMDNQKEQKREATVRAREAKKPRPPRVDFLSPQEEKFIEGYLLTGAAVTAAAQAGYTNPDRAAKTLLRKRLVRGRIASVLSAKEAEKVSMNRRMILDEVKKIIIESKPFERLKALELAAKIEGHMAPRRSITEHRKALEVSPYVELAETLKASGAAWTREQRDAMRAQLFADRAAIDEVLALIEGTPAATH